MTGTAGFFPLDSQRPPAGKERLLVWLAALGAAMVLVVGLLIAVNALKAGPDKLVREYVQALVDGDAERAVTILDPSIPMRRGSS